MKFFIDTADVNEICEAGSWDCSPASPPTQA
jgi:hypothetical protein